MSKNLLKKAKKAAKSVTSSAKEAASSAKSSAKLHIESLAHSRRDAAVMWGMIEKGNHSDAEIKEICKEKGFTQLLSEI